jgi:hypothetical protein
MNRSDSTRTFKSRPALVVRPSFVSQETAFLVLGVTPRKFLDWIVPLCPDDVIPLGRTMLLPIEVAEAKLRTLGRDGGAGAEHGDNDGGQPTTVDAVLASVGVRRRRSR